MVGWHHRLDGHEFEQALGVGDGQGGLQCCSPWGRKESDTTWQLNKANKACLIYLLIYLYHLFLFLSHVCQFHGKRNLDQLQENRVVKNTE